MDTTCTRRRCVFNALTHVAVWVVLILIPLMVQLRYSDEINIRHITRTWLMLLGLGISFYANFSLAIDKFLYTKKYFYFIIFNVIVFIVARYLDNLFNWAIDCALNIEHKNGHESFSAWDWVRLYNSIILYTLGVGASLGLRYISRVAEIDADRERLQHEKLETEVNLLKYQLQPHFFFNTLNNIYSLIGQTPTDAQKAVHSLSKMMRYVLYDNTATHIALKSELEFISNFVSLKRLSLGSNVDTQFNFPEDTYGFTLPPLLLIPLVENAFKHGVIPGEPSSIICNITVTSERLDFEIKNTINTSKENEDRSHSGIGLQNLKRLLDLQYGKTYSLTSSKDDKENIYTAKLTLPSTTIDRTR